MNDNDDDGEPGVVDKDRPIQAVPLATPDPDLKPVSLSVNALPHNGVITMTPPSGLRVWTTQRKSQLVNGPWDLTDAQQRAAFEGLLANGLWIEGTAPGTGELSFTHDLSGATDKVKLTIIRVDLDVDTNRDTQINDSDETGEEAWTITCGAFVSPQHTQTTGNIISELPRLIVEPPGVPAPAGFKLRLRKRDPASQTYLQLVNQARERIPFTASGDSLVFDLPSWPAQGDMMYIANDQTRWPGLDTPQLELELLSPAGDVLKADKVLVKVAPVILPPECATASTVYSTQPMPGVPVDRLVTGGVRWTQDCVKLLAVQFQTGSTEDLFADLFHPVKGMIAERLRDDRHIAGVEWPVGGEGGNMMASGPRPGAPFGKILLGTKHQASAAYWNAQGVQPVVNVNTTWLYVGHVDEAVMIAGPTTVLVADPWKAADLLHQEIVAGNEEGGIWFGTGIAGSVSGKSKKIREIAIATDAVGQPKKTTLPHGVVLLPEDETIDFGAASCFEVEDVLRVDDELMSVTGVDANGQVSVERGYGGTAAFFHGSNAVIYAISRPLRENLLDEEHVSPASLMLSVRLQVADGLGTGVTFIRMPVLFQYESPPDEVPGFVAASANVVNCLIGTGAIYYSKTGCAAFRNYIASVLPNAQDVDVWDDYHCQMGEVHCGTAVRRELSPAPPWWEQVDQDWH